MTHLLSIETSTAVCSVAVHSNDSLLAFAEVHVEQSHATKLAVLIKDVMKSADIGMTSLSAVAVSAGPGSYTGLRIGTATAKGLCYSRSVPLISVGTLDLLVAQVSRVNLTRAWLCPMIDARRMEVYCLLADADQNILQPVQAKVIDEVSFGEELDSAPIIFFGDGAAKCSEVIKHPNAFFIAGVTPSAAYLGGLAWRKFQDSAIEDLVHYEPFYLKEFRVKKPTKLKDVVPNKIG